MDRLDFGRMLRGIIQNVNGFIGAQVEDYGIKSGQYEYFLMIYSQPGINQLELGRMKNVGKGSVSKALKILEDGDFIIRESDKNDKRNVRCFVSEKGKKIVDDLMGIRKNSEERLFKGFSKEEKQMLGILLKKLLYNSEDLKHGN